MIETNVDDPLKLIPAKTKFCEMCDKRIKQPYSENLYIIKTSSRHKEVCENCYDTYNNH